MKNVLFIVLTLISLSAAASDKHKPVKIPVSRWREVKRMMPDSSIVTFSDTLFIQFLKKDSFSYHSLGGFIYNGAYTIDDDSLLDFGTARYKVVLKRPTTLVLKNETGIFVFDVDVTDTVKITVLAKEEKLLPVTNIELMVGHWTVYKRMSDRQIGAIDPATDLKAVYITGPSTDGKQGYVFGGRDPGNSPSWYIKNLGTDQALDCDGKNRRIFKVVKCQGGEMILEEDGMKYYLKQFK